MRDKRTFILLLALCALLVAGCDDGKRTVPPNAVAVVDDEVITKDSFNFLMSQARSSFKQQGRPFPIAGSTEYEQLKQNAIGYLVQLAQFEAEAKNQDIEIKDETIDKRVEDIIKQYFGGDRAKFKQQVKAAGQTEKSIREQIRGQIIQQELFKKATKDVKVDEEAIEEYYKKNSTQYVSQPSREVRHLLVKEKALADKLYTQLKGGADFAKLVTKYTTDEGSKKTGGKYTEQKGQFVAPFEKVAFSLKVNEISKPVKTQFGWHIIQALGPLLPERKTPLAEVKESIRQQLLQTRRKDEMTEWTNDLKKRYAKKTSYQVGFAPTSTATPLFTSTTQSK